MEMAIRNSMEATSISLRGFSTRLSSCVAALVLAAVAMVGMSGCTADTWQNVITQVDTQIPQAQAFIATGSAAAIVAAQAVDPPVAVIIQTTADTVQASLVVLKQLCDAYLVSKDPAVLGKINAALSEVLNKSAASLLDAAHIENAVSRGIATVVLGSLLTTLQLIYAIVQRAQSKSQVAYTATMRTYRLVDVAAYLDRQRVEQAAGVSFDVAMQYEVSQGF